MPVYIVSFELGSDSEEFRSKGISGGFVQCLTPSNDIRDAISKAESALVEDGYSIKIIERAEVFDPDNWQHESEIIQASKDAVASGIVQYGPFDVFDDEYEH